MTFEQVYTSANGATSHQSVVYYDAFGLPVTTVDKNSSTEGRNLVILTEYDALNHPTKEWLPVPMSNISSLVNATDFSVASSSEYADNRAYKEKQYEQSFFTNVTKETLSGEAYSSHPTTTNYCGNKSSNAMLCCYRFETNGGYVLRKNGTYADGELSVIKTDDADGRTKLTFFDWRGNKILERSVIDINKGTMADTYYIYDALGNLCFVLPPALRGMRVATGTAWNIHECAPLRQYAYFYRYDNRGLLDDGSYATINDLMYTYTGNQVVKIDDSAAESPCYDGAMHFIDGADEEEEYTYDANGNMTSDLNKRILHIDYNAQNLPRQIDVNGSRVGSGLHKTIKYTYTADGTKLRAEYNSNMYIPINNPSIDSTMIGGGSFIRRDSVIGGGSLPVVNPTFITNPSTSNIRTTPTIDYCANLIYENKTLSTILFDGGYASVDADGNITMHYYVKDHLGSNRLVVDGNGNIEETNHYYPFGALMGDSKNVKQNKYTTVHENSLTLS